MSRSLEGNLSRYNWFQFASSCYGWLPVFFLYFSQYVPLASAIQLSVIYYLSVCIFEVPSGYLSDKVGRRMTLLLSGISFLLSYGIFLIAADFTGLAIGQIFLAMGIAMISGTDVAFLYDSLLAANKSDEYAKREAIGYKYSFAASAISALLGGILGLIDLRLAYLLSLLGAVWMVFLALQFVEPKPKDRLETKSMFSTMALCVGRLSDKVLAWLFAVMTLMYCLEHITYEFYQPFVKLLEIDWLEIDNSALVSSVVIATSMFGGVLGAHFSVRLFNRLGIKILLFAAFFIQLTILAGLSYILAGTMLSLVIFRNFPMAMISAPVNAAIAPRIDSHMRATYLSIQSLSARLALSGLLFGLSRTIDPGQTLDWPNLSLVLRESLLIAVACTAIVILIAPNFKNESKEVSESVVDD